MTIAIYATCGYAEPYGCDTKAAIAAGPKTQRPDKLTSCCQGGNVREGLSGRLIHNGRVQYVWGEAAGLTDAAEALLAQADEHVEAEIAVGWTVKVFEPPQMIAVLFHVLSREENEEKGKYSKPNFSTCKL